MPLPPVPTWKDLPRSIREPYALTDAAAHLAVHRELSARIHQEGLGRVYRLDRSVLSLLVRQEEIGMACSKVALRLLSRSFAREFADVCQDINQLAGFEVNPLSGDQVSDCLFGSSTSKDEGLGVTPTRPTPTKKRYSTEGKYLKARQREHEIIPLILRARQLDKYIGTYTSRLPAMLVEGRYHPNWKYTRTATGRLAEEIILLIPKHPAFPGDTKPKDLRNAFHAAEGHSLVSVDLSQIELRTMAHLSKDPRLLGAYERGEDIHAQVAHELLGAPKKKEDQDDSLHRLPAKTINFGIINGMSEYGMLDQLHEQGQLQWDLDQVRDALRGWWQIHRGVKRYWTERVAEAKSRGYVEDLFGRRRYLWAIHTTDDKVYAEAARQCLCPIQSTADGISKVWNARIWRHLILPRHRAKRNYCEPWVRLHDATILECSTRVAKTVKQEMIDLVPDLLDIPTTAEGSVGQLWGELKG